MPFVRKNDSQYHRPPTDAKKLFIGRMNELHFFIEDILKPDELGYNILSIWGQGGVGKTTLLNRYVEEAHATYFKDYCLTAFVDEHQTTPVNIMERFADQLHIAGEFEKALGRYKESLRKLQSEREATRDAVLRKATTEVAGSVVKSVPFVGDMLNQGVELAVGQIWDEVHYRQRLKDAERLEDPISDLTKAFVNELNAAAETQVALSAERTKRKRRVLLFFDTFEQLATEVAPWLLDYFLPMDISLNVVLVIAGRSLLESSTPDDPKRWLPYVDQNVVYQMSLEGFTEDETRNYLIERGITDASRIETIWRLSGGLPLFLALWTSNPQGTVDPTADVVANFLRWIPEQEQAKRKLVLDAALLSRPFNQDELEAFPYLSEQERPPLYRWLRAQPFIRSNPQDGRQSYHELAQEQFSRHLNQLSPSGCYATRRALAEYYLRQLKSIEAEAGKDIYHTAQWLELTLALAHQLLLLPDEASHIQAVEQMVNAFEHAPQMEEIVRMLRGLSQEQQDGQISVGARQTAEQLLRYVEADEADQEVLMAFDYLLGKVTHDPFFSKEVLASMYDKRGDAYSNLEEYQRAIADYDHAIDLDPKYVSACNQRGNAYFSLEQYQLAIADYDRAIDLDPNDAVYYSNRGNAYYGLKEYQQVIADYDRAIELDPNDASYYVDRGSTYSDLKQYQQALADYEYALELDPNLAEVYTNRGFTYLWLKDLNRSLADYIHSWELDSADIYSGWRIEWLRMYQERPTITVAEQLEAVAAVDSQIYFAHICLGVALWIRGYFDQALTELKMAVSLDQGNKDAYFWQGMVCTSLGQDEEAIVAIEKSLELGLPPVLLALLRWFEQDRPEFYGKYAVPLLARYDIFVF